MGKPGGARATTSTPAADACTATGVRFRDRTRAPAEPAGRSKRQREMLLRAIASALGTLVIQTAPVPAAALAVGLWTGWFDDHPGVLAALIGWFGLLLVEIWVECRHWKAKRNARKTPP